MWTPPVILDKRVPSILPKLSCNTLVLCLSVTPHICLSQLFHWRLEKYTLSAAANSQSSVSAARLQSQCCLTRNSFLSLSFHFSSLLFLLLLPSSCLSLLLSSGVTRPFCCAVPKHQENGRMIGEQWVQWVYVYVRQCSSGTNSRTDCNCPL